MNSFFSECIMTSFHYRYTGFFYLCRRTMGKNALFVINVTQRIFKVVHAQVLIEMRVYCTSQILMLGNCFVWTEEVPQYRNILPHAGVPWLAISMENLCGITSFPFFHRWGQLSIIFIIFSHVGFRVRVKTTYFLFTIFHQRYACTPVCS